MEFRIRLAAPADAIRCAEIHTESWVFAYSNCVPTEILEKYNANRPAIWTKMLENNRDMHYVITLDDTIIGFFTVMPARDADLAKTVYELVGLYLTPDYIGKGFGRRTMEEIKAMISQRGYNAVSLWVLTENFRAKAFYEKCGFVADGVQKDSGLLNIKEERYILS
ncbi:MAG: GNAT family N-acetyltransferase [Ruminococcaceae bacterium]|nr:GNAT family N-acetyltransferase [Oscillospiraceae bacterium]